VDAEWEDKVRERAHALWECEGRPEGGSERHWAQAEEQLRAEGDGMPAAPAATAGTETWTGQDGTVGEGGGPADPGGPERRQQEPGGEGRH